MDLSPFFGFIPLLGIAPYYFPVDPSVASEASAQGYNNAAAYALAALWLLVIIAACALYARGDHGGGPGGRAETPTVPPARLPGGGEGLLLLEIALIAAACAVVYFPPALSPYGPYIEDNAFLSMLHRMNAGQVPYRDFELLYGPLMLYPAHLWMKLFGYSMASYYAFLGAGEALQYSILLAVLHRYFPRLRDRAFAFFLIGSLVLNTYLGLNYNGLRRLLPAYIILLVASRPHSGSALAAAALLLGILLSYSHEYGVACLIAVIVVLGSPLRQERALRALRRAAAVAAISLVTWLACSGAILGRTFPAYVRSSFHVVERMSAGEQAFAFHWTVHSLALFGLLCLTGIIIGQGLGKRGRPPLESGDRFLLGGLVYALVGLRGGLNRADIFHLTPPVLVLVLAFVLRPPATVFTYSGRAHRLAMTLIAIMASTYLLALAPSASYYGAGLLRGWRDVIGGTNTASRRRPLTRAPAIEFQRRHPGADVLALASYLADRTRSARPVVFYGRAWWLDKRVGVPASVYPPDDFLMSEEIGAGVREFLEQRSDALVVMRRQAYEYVLGRADPEQFTRYTRIEPPTLTKAIARRLSSIHFTALNTEAAIKEERWKKTVGLYVRSHYHVAREFGRFLVLERKTINAL